MENPTRMTQARNLAEEVHKYQTDKLEIPYIYHVLDVAKRVQHLGEDFEIVGLLHDSVEDSPLTLDDIELQFGKAVRNAVDGMTKREGEDYHTEYILRVLSNPISKEVKIADASHNISKAHLISEPKDSSFAPSTRYTSRA